MGRHRGDDEAESPQRTQHTHRGYAGPAKDFQTRLYRKNRRISRSKAWRRGGPAGSDPSERAAGGRIEATADKAFQHSPPQAGGAAGGVSVGAQVRPGCHRVFCAALTEREEREPRPGAAYSYCAIVSAMPLAGPVRRCDDVLCSLARPGLRDALAARTQAETRPAQRQSASIGRHRAAVVVRCWAEPPPIPESAAGCQGLLRAAGAAGAAGPVFYK